MPPRIKFCGFTRPEDVSLAVGLGVDAIGLNLAHGPRRITVEQAADLARLVPPFVTTVALFVDADEEAILEVMYQTRCQVAQLHGNEPAELCERLRARFPVIKSFAVADRAGLERLRGFPADAYLLDTAVPGCHGGTGQAWDHGLLAGVELGRPFILAGGLTPATAAAAARLAPWAVDVASGIESSPGVKDADKMAAFIAACRGG
jgi:phosphoribosylanthranilate isomerase